MGKRGPAPKPSNLKLLQGNPGKREVNKKEPKPPVSLDVPKPPVFLSRYAKQEWNRIAPMLHQLRLLTESDITALAAYCQNYHRWLEAEKAIRTYGMTDVTDKGNIIQRPEVGIANTAMKLMRDYGREFGLTPSSRAALHIENEEKETDPLFEFLVGGKGG